MSSEKCLGSTILVLSNCSLLSRMNFEIEIKFADTILKLLSSVGQSSLFSESIISSCVKFAKSISIDCLHSRISWMSMSKLSTSLGSLNTKNTMLCNTKLAIYLNKLIKNALPLFICFFKILIFFYPFLLFTVFVKIFEKSKLF